MEHEIEKFHGIMLYSIKNQNCYRRPFLLKRKSISPLPGIKYNAFDNVLVI